METYVTFFWVIEQMVASPWSVCDRVRGDRILGNPAPDFHVARFLPIRIGQGRFSPCPVGMHDQCMTGVARKVIGQDLTECIGKKAFAGILYGAVHIFLCRGNAAPAITGIPVHITHSVP